AELTGDASLYDGVRRFEPRKRLDPLLLVPEHRDVHGPFAQVRRDRDAGDGDEADARILQLCDRLGDDGTDRLVDPTHAAAHGPTPRPRARRATAPRARAPTPARPATPRREPPAARPHARPATRTPPSAHSAARGRGGRPPPPTRRTCSRAAPSPT